MVEQKMPDPFYDNSPLDPTVAVNIYGWAIKDPLVDTRLQNTLINCYKLEDSDYTAAWEADREDFAERQTLEFTDRELDESGGSHTSKFLVIGYAYPAFQKRHGFIRKNVAEPHRALGTKDNPGKIVDIPDGKLPWLVVMKVSREKPWYYKECFGLFQPTDGLCHAYTLPQEHVFYFHEFRDETSTIAGRKRKWQETAEQRSIKPRNPRSDLPRIDAGARHRLMTWNEDETEAKSVVQGNRDIGNLHDTQSVISHQQVGPEHSEHQIETRDGNEPGNEPELVLQGDERHTGQKRKVQHSEDGNDRGGKARRVDSDTEELSETLPGRLFIRFSSQVVQRYLHAQTAAVDKMTEEQIQAWREAWQNARVRITLPTSN